MRVWAFDAETYPIEPAVQFPPAVCFSRAELLYYPGEGWTVARPEVLLWRDAIDWLRFELQQGSAFIGAEAPFDVMTSVFWDVRDPEEMIALWSQALEADRVTDVALRQPLIDYAHGHQAEDYRLDTICRRLGTPTQPTKSCTWRKRYNELDGLPLRLWPAEAIRYSEEDAKATAEVWIHQEKMRMLGSPYFPGRDMLLDQYRQMRGSLPLKDISGMGHRTDRRTVERYGDWAEAKRAKHRDVLLGASPPLIRSEYKRDWKAIDARAALSQPLPRTKTGKPSKGVKILRAHPDPAVRAMADWPASAPWLHAQGLAEQKWKRCTALAIERISAAFCSMGKPVMTAVTKDEETGELKEHVRCDSDACEQSGDAVMKSYATFASVNKLLTTDFQMLRAGSFLPFHARYKALQSTGRTATGADEGDDDQQRGNAQNTPRAPGVRECYCGRQAAEFVGCTLIPVEEDEWLFDSDFSAVELHAFSQVCYFALGWSKLGDMLNTFDPPLDPPIKGEEKGAWHDAHLEIAAALCKCTYDEAKRRKAAGDKVIGRSRTAGKGVNFGRKGAMGVAKFVAYCWNNYRVKLGGPNATVKEAMAAAKELIDLHDRITPEFPHYSKWVQSFARRKGSRDTLYDIIHPYSGRLRAGLFFTDAHNYMFQGLAADLAKVALWLVFKARWGLSELGKADPLYRAKIVLFTHDSITGSVAKSRAPEAAVRLGQLMEQASRMVLPQCPSRAEPACMTRLSKDAEARRDEATGRLIAWDPWVEGLKKAQKFLAKLDAWPGSAAEFCDDVGIPRCTDRLAALTAYCEKEGLPPYVIEDTLAACTSTATADSTSTRSN
jgi:hypothetical protein